MTNPGGVSWGKLALLAALVSVVVAFFALGGQQYLSLDTVKTHRDALLAFTSAHFVAALAIAFVAYAGATAFSLPGGLVLSLTMGFLFGRWVGTLLVVIAATIGATLVFVAARYLFADAARRRLGPLGAKISVRTFVLATLIGIVPGSFVFVNLGQTLGRIDSLSGLLSTETVGAFVLLGVLALAPVLVRKFRSSAEGKA